MVWVDGFRILPDPFGPLSLLSDEHLPDVLDLCILILHSLSLAFDEWHLIDEGHIFKLIIIKYV